jgi:hypothetical protein
MNLAHLRGDKLVPRVSHSLEVVILVNMRQPTCTRDSFSILTRRGLIAAEDIEKKTIYIFELIILSCQNGL